MIYKAEEIQHNIIIIISCYLPFCVEGRGDVLAAAVLVSAVVDDAVVATVIVVVVVVGLTVVGSVVVKVVVVVDTGTVVMTVDIDL